MRTRRLFSLFLALLVLVALVVGCGGQSQTRASGQADFKPAKTQYPLTLIDGAGRSVTIPAEPKRIVSTAPSNSELLFALGKGASLVGRSDFCDYPPEVTKVESIGGIMKPNYEKILSLKPDLILFIGGSEEVRNTLVNDHKQNLFVVDPQDFASLYTGIWDLGRVVDAQQKAADLIASMQKSVKEVQDRSAKATAKPKVFYEVWHDPLMTTGPSTFIDDMIRISGGINAAADAKERWATYSLEQLAANNPDIIITSAEQAGQVKERKGWEGIKAVKESKVYGVEDQNLVVRPGPRLIQGLRWFAERIHPELYTSK